MTYNEALAAIAERRSMGILPGLDRMKEAANAVGAPQNSFPVIHIAGTNGKGSTATMIASALTACGYKTGLYTSPAVTDLRDTILIDGVPISEDAFAQATQALCSSLPCPLSEFEFVTLLTFYAFRDHRVDIAVIECGMGGEGDATNIIPPPLCAVFTPIANDHAAFLGNSIEEIAVQKSGIIKPPCDIVVSPHMHEEALGVIFEKAAQSGLRVHMPSAPTVQADGSFEYRDRKLTLSLPGAHQCCNAVAALTALERLQTKGFGIDWSAAINALCRVTLPCRQEIFQREPLVMLDGAHNPHGIRMLCDTIRSLTDTPITLIIGMLCDKDHERCFQLLAPLCDRIICCTPIGTPRAMEASRLANIAKQYHAHVEVIDDPVLAFESAKKAADCSPIVVGGSFYTASAVRRYIVK